MYMKRMSVKLQAALRLAVTVTVAGSSAALATACWGQASTDAARGYPSRPIRLIVPFPPGPATDITARTIAQELAKTFGQQIIADNRGGAGGRLGAELASRAPPDGYTLVLSGTGGFTIAPVLYPKLPYNTLRDFDHISNLVTQPQVLLVSPTIPVKTVAELVDYARPRPGKPANAR